MGVKPQRSTRLAVTRTDETRTGISTPVRLTEPSSNAANCSIVEERADQSTRSGIDTGLLKTTLRALPSALTTRVSVGAMETIRLRLTTGMNPQTRSIAL